MDINRTGPRNPNLADPAQKTERTAGRFDSSASQPVDPGSTTPPAGVPAGITRGDINDPRKTEEVLKRCFGDLLDNAGSQLGVAVTDAQKGHLANFLNNDPVMRGKLISYLQQVVK